MARISGNFGMIAGKTDAMIGAAATAVGGTGITIQMMMNVGSFVVLVINGVLALGGLYLLYLRLVVARREMRRTDPPRNSE